MPSLSSRAVFQSTRPVWGATHSPASDPGCARISIHAPRVGRDSSFRRCPCTAAAFQSTRPVWGATTRTTGRACRHGQFQSTRPVWGATRAGSLSLSLSTYFNPRAPCGARRLARSVASIALIISIHAPRVGRDAADLGLHQCLRQFQSTRPVWGATHGDFHNQNKAVHFNPRAPCGARLGFRFEQRLLNFDFNPRAPCGARPGSKTGDIIGESISIHAPRVGRDRFQVVANQIVLISIHAPRVGRDGRECFCRTV